MRISDWSSDVCSSDLEDIYRLASDPVRQATDQRNYEYVQGVRKEQKRKNPGGIHSDVVKISYRESHHHIIENIFPETQPHRGEAATRIALEVLDQTIAPVGVFLDLLLGRRAHRRITDLGTDILANAPIKHAQP